MYKKIHENVKITPDSKAFQFWLNPPASIYRKYYLFEVTNPQEVLNGAKPNLRQRGPYTFREKWEKRNLEFLNEEEIKYTPVSTLYFEPTLSIGNESDLITFLNIPAAAMIEQIKTGKFDFIDSSFANGVLNHLDTELFITRSIHELITGYNDPLMDLASTYMPSMIKGDTFSLMNGQNGTEWQSYVMRTGNDNPLNVGKIVSWNGKKKLNFWSNDKANEILGTDGSFYPPFLNRTSRIDSFSPDMCRTYSLTYLRDNEIAGVKTYDFHLPENIFAEPSINPENEGFCDGECFGSGVLNISNCYGGVSGFISQPHFLNADEKIKNSVDGLTPNKDIHDFIIHFEPTTGVPIGGNVRLQINFYLTQHDEIDLVKNIKPVLLPVLWFEAQISLNPETRDELSKVAFYVRLVTIIPIAMISTGILLILVSSFILIKRFLKPVKHRTVREKKEIYSAEKANLFSTQENV
ncbi:unnamed protein product [Brachionus calyciflorus]|uniref:Uncharacterized protein n=1 Tax=Brachionus calyciflorus TaxID=104777 RepID=A0A814J0T3_9BILA|nr:unnamed protein product [Brachionus calyciflorus]